MHRAWRLSQASLQYAEAIYVAAAEGHHRALLTADARIEHAGAPISCEIITIARIEEARHANTDAGNGAEKARLSILMCARLRAQPVNRFVLLACRTLATPQQS